MVDQTGAISPLNRTIARAIISSLADGVVPRVGAHLFTAGRERWLQSLEEDLQDLADEASLDGRLRIINGRNGDGKTHLMHLLRQRALDAAFAVSYVVISDQVPLHRWDLVYSEIVRNLASRTRPDAPGLRAILNPRSPDPDVATDFMQKAIAARSLGGIHPSFAEAIYRYCTEQTVNVDAEQDMLLLGSWLEGHNHRLAGMGVGGAVDRTNGAAMLRSLALTLQHFGFQGLVILVDEVESVLNQATPLRRESYQTLRLLVDRESMPVRTLVAASTTPPMYTDPQRGMPTYPALWSRIRIESSSEFINYNATLIDLTRTPLSESNYLEIANSIRSIHARARNWKPAEDALGEFIDGAIKVAASGRLTLTYSPTRVFVKMIADTLERMHLHSDFRPSAGSLVQQFGTIDQLLG